MWRKHVLSLCLAVALGASGGQVLAQNQAAEVSGKTWPAGVKALIAIQRAAHELNYRGVFTYQYGNSMQSSRVTHIFDGKDEREKLEVLDGKPREYLRLNEDVVALIPEHQTLLREHRRGDWFPGLLLSDPKAIETYYSIELKQELSRVAGRNCRVIDILPRDKHRYGYRLCADEETGLLLRARTIADDVQMVEQIAFTQLTMNPKLTDAMLESGWSTEGWATVTPDEKPIDLYALGWRIPAPPGYVATLQVARMFADDTPVNQVVLSDGLATISIFIEPYQKERSDLHPRGAARNGSVNIYGIQVGKYWLTVLGEVPAGTLEQIAKAVQFVPNTATR
jgi:sigma-E factor negative regulatory protein RseB